MTMTKKEAMLGMNAQAALYMLESLRVMMDTLPRIDDKFSKNVSRWASKCVLNAIECCR